MPVRNRQTTAPGGRTSGQHSFAQIPKANIPRSSFNRSCGVKTTLSFGDLVPIFTDEAMPGDTMSLNLNTFARLATPIHPMMDNMYLDTFFFFVPLRLLWENFEKFMGEQDNPDDSTDFLTPQIISDGNGFDEGSIADYFGMPTQIPTTLVSAFWHRAYSLIWNDWFRDQNLQDSVVIDVDDGPDNEGDHPLQKRGKRHDYFTSCLPFPQKGTAVSLPFGQDIPIIPDPAFGVDQAFPRFQSPGAGPDIDDAVWEMGTPSGTDGDLRLNWSAGQGNAGDPIYWTSDTGLIGDMSQATAATINNLREAFQIQKLFERDARGGSRYTEIVRSHFGVTSPDARLQRPEYLGGSTQVITVNPVANTSSTGAAPEEPLGHLAGYGTSAFNGKGFIKSFTEHGVILGLCAARADLNYQQGLNRMYSRRTRFDYYWPAFAHLGEQEVLNKEIFLAGNPSDEDVFGYQERYAEYRYKSSIVTHRMRSNAQVSLDTWHLSQDFASAPLLNEEFIIENPPIQRAIAINNEPHLILDAFFGYKCVRPMPTYGVPGLIDHF